MSPAQRKRSAAAATQAVSSDVVEQPSQPGSQQRAPEQPPRPVQPHVVSLEGIVNTGTTQPAPEIGNQDQGGAFKPKVLRVGDNRSRAAEERGRLQPKSGVHFPKSVSHPDNRDAKRQKVEPQGFTPSFGPLCGAITGVPFYSGRAKPVGQNDPTPFVQPMWPDPEMLRRLEEEGSLIHPRKVPTLKEFEDLSSKVLRLESMVVKLQAQLNKYVYARSRISETVPAGATSQPTVKSRVAAERVD